MLNMLLDLIFKISIMPQKYEHITKNIYFIQEKSVNIKKNGQMQNNQRRLVDRHSLNGLYSI